MGTYATNADVKARLPNPPITTTSEPSETDVDGWIDTAEARLHACLKTAQIPTPVTDSDGVEVMKDLTLRYAEGKARMARASAGGDGTNDDGRTLVEQFDATCEKILEGPSVWGAMVGGGATPGTAVQLRGHPLNHPDGKSIAAGDFAPEFTRNDGGDQF